MSSPNSSQKGFGALWGRIFGAGSRETTATLATPDPAPPMRRFPKAPAPIVAPAPQVLTPRKGVGTMLRKAVHPGDAPFQQPGALWAAQAETEEPRSAKPHSRLLNLPRTMVSLLRKAPPARKKNVLSAAQPEPEPEPAPARDPAFTRRKERDYPII